ncbi:tellurite resistance protein-related protein [hydrothermal vent metagenome]|uniref:Tellurite resistance protein-related protein n=1 Tax=hydrothermal vent metagenome TaxID=652676 RepID=A0A1W1CMJ0_9ZZZZ
MAQEDRQRWNEKHAKDMMPKIPVKLVSDSAHLAFGKQALDIACGNGRHSKYLVSLGFEVDALDISSVAIEQLQGISHIHAREVDFDTYTLEKNKYDLIVCTYFLERRLFPQIIEALNPGGLLIMETFIHHEKNERIPSNPAFRLHAGELQEYFFKKLEIISLREWWDRDYQGYKTMKASLVARKNHV